jgi:hypothetical protein
VRASAALRPPCQGPSAGAVRPPAVRRLGACNRNADVRSRGRARACGPAHRAQALRHEHSRYDRHDEGAQSCACGKGRSVKALPNTSAGCAHANPRVSRPQQLSAMRGLHSLHTRPARPAHGAHGTRVPSLNAARRGNNGRPKRTPQTPSLSDLSTSRPPACPRSRWARQHAPRPATLAADTLRRGADASGVPQSACTGLPGEEAHGPRTTGSRPRSALSARARGACECALRSS